MTPRQRNEKPLGLNAVGKPYGANYDPNYKLSGVYGKPARLSAPYSREMRFVGDPPRTVKHRRQRKLPPPAPLLDGQLESNDALNVAVVAKLLRDIENKLRTLRKAMLDSVEKAGRDHVGATAIN
jgi:hypothetical protein